MEWEIESLTINTNFVNICCYINELANSNHVSFICLLSVLDETETNPDREHMHYPKPFKKIRQDWQCKEMFV